MIFPVNTEWKLSSKGNYWRKRNGVILVVGGSDAKGYWVKVGDKYLPIRQDTLQFAKDVAEYGAD